ncbi:hypothetical protein Pmani_009296 [Petrolisthes manimaculis]|uniref:Transmembrane protein 5 n=1 Tax=Petrolisthes manimaculis TaxID=1843537 RepID=A0AAE1Q3U8_9EUCA|nr:hypothetical protein Pmani_009296 [Petrolisthes manimaculis]
MGQGRLTVSPGTTPMLSSGLGLQRVLLAMCLIQIAITSYLAIIIFDVTGFSGMMMRRPNKPPNLDKADQSAAVLDFDIGENEAAIVLAEQEVKPHVPGFDVKWDKRPPQKPRSVVVEVWSKAAVGAYLWHHILDGTEALDDATPGATLGELNLPGITLRYRSGPGVVPESVPRDVSKVVLVINGRTQEKVNEARRWLHHLSTLAPAPPTLLVMLGNEECDNEWVQRYVSPRGPVVAVLLTYDDPHIDNIQYHQWPLGVATYRQFPIINEDQISPTSQRKYVCNFQATIYPNSSRVDLHKLLMKYDYGSTHCLIKVRESWVPNETPDSMDEYVRSLLESDLTLCPAGINTETYRVYEAMSAGSTPLIEDVPSRGHCDKSGWRLLKKLNPPVIWVKSWKQLPKLLAKERRYSNQHKALRRLRVSQCCRIYIFITRIDIEIYTSCTSSKSTLHGT